MTKQLYKSGLPIIVTLLSVAACAKFDEPAGEDPAPIYGCYTASDAPWLIVEADGIKVEGASAPVPFRYESRKVGMVLNVPLLAEESGGHLSFARAERHLFRVVWSEAGPGIIVASSPDAEIWQYKREFARHCTI